MNLDSNAERDLFEAAFRAAGFADADYRFEREGTGYASDFIHDRWIGWQLARSQPSEWVATSERMPELRQLVWCHTVNPMEESNQSPLRWNGACWINRWGAEIIDEVTHWMPLPKPPALLPPNAEAKS